MDKEIQNIRNAIQKTGFILEYEISKILTANNWNIINNKYYIDDITSSPREIDILAYKATIIEGISIYTAILISCKKSSENVWAFITKEIDFSDPNIEQFPIKYWSNSKIYKTLKTQDLWLEHIKEKNNSQYSEIISTKRNAFAFQEVNEKKGTPQNDKKIYNSIISTIKAVEYEKKSLSTRSKAASVYNFHQITILDGVLYDIQAENDFLPVRKSHIKYLNKFIVYDNDSFHLIHFIDKNEVQRFIENMNKLADDFTLFHKNCLQDFQNDFLQKHKYIKLYEEEFRKEIIPFLIGVIAWQYQYELYSKIDFNLVSRDNETLSISLHIEKDHIIEKLNQDNNVMSKTKSFFEKYYKYYGPIEFVKFEIDDDIPF